MANMYDTANCSSSSSQPEPDDFSLFLHQIMLRSSSSSSSSSSNLVVQKGGEMQSFRPACSLSENQDFGVKSSVFSGSDRISMPEASSGLNLPTYGGFTFPRSCFGEGVVNVSSSSVSVGTADDDINEYNCESEKGFEGVVEEATAKPTPRNPSKRCRAAEVHNLSEKRRRSRINEKMKALQNLIPNSNKTDKASMLDEAIEYLKQLQLQVQLLTMRNGVNIYPMCSPGLLQSNDISQLRMGYYEGNRLLNVNVTRALPLHQDTQTNFLFTLPDLYTNPKQTSVANLNVPESSFGMESSPQVHLGSFELPPPASSKGICMEEKLPCQLVKKVLSRRNAVGHMAAEATSSIRFNEQASDLEENTLEACICGRDQSTVLLLKNLKCETIHLPQVEGVVRGRSPLHDNSV